jgi:hypothetical protein
MQFIEDTVRERPGVSHALDTTGDHRSGAAVSCRPGRSIRRQVDGARRLPSTRHASPNGADAECAHLADQLSRSAPAELWLADPTRLMTAAANELVNGGTPEPTRAAAVLTGPMRCVA